MLQTLPSDEVRQVMWRFADGQGLQQLVQSARSVARGKVAQVVAGGARLTSEWTKTKDEMLKAFEDAGINSIFAQAEPGGDVVGHRYLALALAAFELGWVDGGAAASCVTHGLALAPIAVRGTQQQRKEYLSPDATSAKTPSLKTTWGAFCLTEPLPYAGVDTGVLSGTVRIDQWEEGQDPVLHVMKRGRFIGNMDFANFVVATVDSDDPRLQGTCMIVLREDDEGEFDRGPTAAKLAHQLSSTRDPVFDLKVPASRIVGGYTTQEGVIVPNYSHLRILQPMLARTRVAAGMLTAAKVLSAVEPIIRYQRQRYRGESAEAESPRQQRGLQSKEDALHRLVDIWATGEAAASLGFAAARQFDALDELLRDADELAAIKAGRPRKDEREARQAGTRLALEYLQLANDVEEERDEVRLATLKSDRLVEYLLAESVVSVLSPATKLWNTGHGATILREAVSLMGGCGVTESCPGFLPLKWMDAQVEATFEGPESAHRRQLVLAMTGELFLAQFELWLGEMRSIAAERPGIGACTLASAMELWLWSLRHLQEAKDADGKPIFREQRQGATFSLADALCWLLSARCQIMDLFELECEGPASAVAAKQLPGTLEFLTDLCHVQTARTAGEIGRICAELVFGYNRHPSWDPDCGSCLQADEIDALEGVIPGISVGARITGDVVEADGSHAEKAGPCVRFAGLYEFTRRRSKLDGCLTGARLAKDRAAVALTQVAIPDSLDYPS